jgi:hypothetical protein
LVVVLALVTPDLGVPDRDGVPGVEVQEKVDRAVEVPGVTGAGALEAWASEAHHRSRRLERRRRTHQRLGEALLLSLKCVSLAGARRPLRSNFLEG